jgi:hypothetical protein
VWVLFCRWRRDNHLTIFTQIFIDYIQVNFNLAITVVWVLLAMIVRDRFNILRSNLYNFTFTHLWSSPLTDWGEDTFPYCFVSVFLSRYFRGNAYRCRCNVDGFVAVGTCLPGRCLACDGSQTAIGRSGLMWVVPTSVCFNITVLSLYDFFLYIVPPEMYLKIDVSIRN